MNCAISRLFLLMLEHIEQTTPQEDKKVVDLFTQETIDKIKARMIENKPFIYIPYKPILFDNKKGN